MITYDSRNPWQNKSNDNLLRRLLWFVIWPFGAWLSAMKDANKRSAHVVFFLFNCLLLWHMAPTNYTTDYHDFLGIMDRFVTSDVSQRQLLYDLRAYFTFAIDAPRDIYEEVLIYIIKLFTDNYHVYFVLAAIPVSYCQVKCLRRITSDDRYISGAWWSIAIMMLFFLPRDIIATQNPRFTTGFWLCILSTLNYFAEEKKSLFKLLPIFITPAIHSAMWLYVIITLVALLFPKKVRPLEVLAMMSLPLSFIDAELFRSVDFSSFLPEFLYNWAMQHNTDENYAIMAGAGRAGFWWVGQMFIVATKVMYIYMFLMLVRNKSMVQGNSEAKNMYPFFLIITIVVNLIQSVPVLGIRYFAFFQIYLTFIWYKTFANTDKTTIKFLVGANIWNFIQRYSYMHTAAFAVCMPMNIFITPLPFLIFEGLL